MPECLAARTVGRLADAPARLGGPAKLDDSYVQISPGATL